MTLRPTVTDRDVAHSDRQALSHAILKDIGEISHFVSPHASFVLSPLLGALDSACQSSGTSIGPEFFRWLGNAGWALRDRSQNEIAFVIEALPAMLLGRLIALGVQDRTFEIPAQNGVVRIPQASSNYSAGCFDRLVSVKLSREEVQIGASAYSRRALCDAIDGASPKTPVVANSPIFYHQRGDSLYSMMADLNKTASAPIASDEGLKVVPADRFGDRETTTIMDKMSEALQLLRTYAPEHAAEVEVAIESICVASGRRFVGGSDIWYHGVAVLNLDLDWSTTTYADHLVHEGAHIVLHASNELLPMMINGDQMGAKSPIREDPRPLYNILHATFVFLRLVMFFRRAADKIGTDESMFRLHRHLLGFYEGMAELAQHGRFTAKGDIFFREMLAAREEFQSQLPKPDPKFYKRIGNDYVV